MDSRREIIFTTLTSIPELWNISKPWWSKIFIILYCVFIEQFIKNPNGNIFLDFAWAVYAFVFTLYALILDLPEEQLRQEVLDSECA